MRCPKCDAVIELEDIADDAPFECEQCSALIRVVMDRDSDEPALELVDEYEQDYDYGEDFENESSEYESYDEEEEDDFDDNYNEDYDPNY